jgi:hypothetical protein
VIDRSLQKRPEFLEWLGNSLVADVEEYVDQEKHFQSDFIHKMDRLFKTDRFKQLLNKWLVDYWLRLHEVFEHYSTIVPERELRFIDIPLVRFASKKYIAASGREPKIKWVKAPGMIVRILVLLKIITVTTFCCFRSGLKLFGSRRSFKLMREALWGLKSFGGLYFHDDFIVDNDNIGKEEVLFFSRGQNNEECRTLAYKDMCQSPYAHVDLLKVPLSLKQLFKRVLPLYFIKGPALLFQQFFSRDFFLFAELYLFLVVRSMPYEKVFSEYNIKAELGHNYFSAAHIPEAIVCQSHGARYYLFHWSDNTTLVNSYLTSFLGCDRFFIWGRAHIQVPHNQTCCSGYFFKQLISVAVSQKSVLRQRMGIDASKLVVAFFDESFGGMCKMSEDNYMAFWQTILHLSERRADLHILIKPKELRRYERLSPGKKQMFLKILSQLSAKKGVTVLDSLKWSFIEAIAVSDIVVSQGMTSSSTIAIICGVPGLYLDQANYYDHPFSRKYRNSIVFNDAEALIAALEQFADGQANPLALIDKATLRQFDEFEDDRALDILRWTISGGSGGVS